MLTRASFRQIQDSFEIDPVFVESSRQQPFHTDDLAQTLPLQLGHGAIAGEAKIDNCEAIGGIEASAVKPGTFPAERIVQRCDVTEDPAPNARAGSSGDPGYVDRRRQAVTPSAIAKTAAITRRYSPRSMRSSGFS